MKQRRTRKHRVGYRVRLERGMMLCGFPPARERRGDADGDGIEEMWIPACAGKTRVGAGHSRLSASAIIHYPTAVGFNPQFLNLCSRSE